MSIYSGKHIVIERTHVSNNKQFNAESVEYIVRIRSDDDDDNKKNDVKADDHNKVTTEEELWENDDERNVNKWMNNAFQEIIDYGLHKSNTKPNAYVGIKISVPDSDKNVKPIGLSYRPIKSISSEILVDVLQNVIQSNDVFDVRSRLEISMTIIDVPSGGNHVPLKILNENNIFKHKRNSIIYPRGEYNDNKCLPRALVLGKVFADKCTDECMKKYTRCKSKVLKIKTDLLCKNAGVQVDQENGCVLQDVYKFSKVLKKYEIRILDDFNDPSSVIFRTPRSDLKIFLFYMKDKRHFITIKSLRTFYGFRYQCVNCDKMLNDIKKHRCMNVCNYCRKTPLCPNVPQMVHCNQCNRNFKGKYCFDRHLEQIVEQNDETLITTTCKTYSICDKCYKFIKQDDKRIHICSDKFCNNCRQIVPADHRCFIQPYKRFNPKKWCIIFFDIESRQEKILNTGADTPEYLHEANLCIASQVKKNAFFVVFSFSFCHSSRRYVMRATHMKNQRLSVRIVNNANSYSKAIHV